MALLEVDDLSVRFDTDEGAVHAVDRVSFSLDAGEVLAMVGESGCGKSVTAMSLLRPAAGLGAAVGHARASSGARPAVGRRGEPAQACAGARSRSSSRSR